MLDILPTENACLANIIFTFTKYVLDGLIGKDIISALALDWKARVRALGWWTHTLLGRYTPLTLEDVV